MVTLHHVTSQMVSVNQQQKLLIHLYGLVMTFVSFFTLHDFFGRMTKIKDRY